MGRIDTTFCRKDGSRCSYIGTTFRLAQKLVIGSLAWLVRLDSVFA